MSSELEIIWLRTWRMLFGHVTFFFPWCCICVKREGWFRYFENAAHLCSCCLGKWTSDECRERFIMIHCVSLTELLRRFFSGYINAALETHWHKWKLTDKGKWNGYSWSCGPLREHTAGFPCFTPFTPISVFYQSIPWSFRLMSNLPSSRLLHVISVSYENSQVPIHFWLKCSKGLKIRCVKFTAAFTVLFSVCHWNVTSDKVIKSQINMSFRKHYLNLDVPSDTNMAFWIITKKTAKRRVDLI